MKVAIVDNEYLKSTELNREDVEKLRKWIKQQRHLPEISDLEIILFLHSCYYSIEKAKHTIDTYYTVRTHCPEFFEGRDILSQELKNCHEVVIFSALPKVTIHGYKVIYCKLADINPSKFYLASALKLFALILDLWLMETGTSEGFIILIDMDQVTLGHVARLGIMTVKKTLFYLQEALPVRLKGLHFMNTVSFMDKILALMRPFMKKELMDVMHLHTKLDTLFPFVQQELLPKNYGGEAGTIESLHKNCYNHLVENRDYFLEEEQTRRVNESLREGKAKNSGDLFGVEGNFKKLVFD